MSAFTLNHALRPNANYATASPRFMINFLKTLSIICSGPLKKSNSPLNTFSFKFSSKFLKIALLILVPSAERQTKGTDKHSSSSRFNNISVTSTAFALGKWIEVQYFVTNWFSFSSKNLRRISIYFLLWQVVVPSNIIMKVPFNFLSFVASHCDNNEANPSCKTLCFLSTHSKWFCHIWIRKQFLKKEIPVHALKLNTYSAFEAEICSFTVGSNEMWFRDDDGGVLFTETVVSFVRNLLQLFPKCKFDRHLCFGLFELQFHLDILCIKFFQPCNAPINHTCYCITISID